MWRGFLFVVGLIAMPGWAVPLAVPPEHQGCEKGSDCAFIAPCCEQTAVNKKYLKLYWKDRDCRALDCVTRVPECRDKTCTAKEASG